MFKSSLVLFSLVLGLFSKASFAADNNWLENAEEAADLAWMQAPAVPVNNNQRFGRLGPPQIRIEHWEAAAEALIADPDLNEILAHRTIEYAFVLVRDPENPQAFIQSIRDEGGQEIHRAAYVPAVPAQNQLQNHNENEGQAEIVLPAAEAEANDALDGIAPA